MARTAKAVAAVNRDFCMIFKAVCMPKVPARRPDGGSVLGVMAISKDQALTLAFASRPVNHKRTSAGVIFSKAIYFALRSRGDALIFGPLFYWNLVTKGRSIRFISLL